MHSEQAIRQHNNQKPLNLDGIAVGQIAVLTPLGAQVGQFVKEPIEAIDERSVTIGGNSYLAAGGSLVVYQGKPHTLDLPEPEVAAA